jgi:hemerythrin
MQTISWTAEMLLGVPAMDEAHRALLEELGRLANASDAQFGAGFLALIATFEHDFREEEELMRKINFPAPRTHLAEHARVMSGLRHVEPFVRQGDIESGREVIKQLPHWFLRHLSTMDLMLAVALDIAEHSRRAPPHVFLRTERAHLLNDYVD